LAEPVRQALEFIQKTRSEFLALSANDTGGISSFDGYDPIPKSLARVAAQVAALVAKSLDIPARYDTRIGLDYIYDLVSKAKENSKSFEDLQKKLSVRRLARGKRAPLTDFDQLVLAEILYDDVVSLPSIRNEIWEIKFSGINRGEKIRYELLLSRFRDLLPDAEVIGVSDGCILMRIRGSQRSYQALSRLTEFGVLPKYFEVESLQLSNLLNEDEVSPFVDYEDSKMSARKSIVTASELSLEISSHLERWRPSGSLDPRSFEKDLLQWLGNTLPPQIMTNLQFEEDPKVADQNRRFIFDLGVTVMDSGTRIFIEITKLKNRGNFFRKIELIREFRGSVI
jgi:hypothetical protein